MSQQRDASARAADERDEEEQPDEELRREHLAERDERDDGRGGVSGRAAPASAGPRGVEPTQTSGGAASWAIA